MDAAIGDREATAATNYSNLNDCTSSSSNPGSNPRASTVVRRKDTPRHPAPPRPRNPRPGDRHRIPSWVAPALRSPWPSLLLLLALLALAAFGAESRGLAASASSRPGDADSANVPPSPFMAALPPSLPQTNITIVVQEGKVNMASSSSSTSSSGGGGSGGRSRSDGATLPSFVGLGPGLGLVGGLGVLEADLIHPLVTGDVSGMFADLAPNSSVRISAYSLRIDDMAGLVTPKGYPLEQHVVVTGDGYKLGTFRIPYGRSGAGSARRPPVLLVHGISLSSTCWVVNEPSESLAFILADRGYDVWMMNTRGNTFSREHVALRDTQPSFWRFTVDEMAHADLRETIKYIQDATGIGKISLVGHSQGATLGLMALADDPWLAESVSVLVALAPCVYVKHMAAVVLKNFCRQANTSALFNLLPPQELIYMSPQMQQTYLNGVCQVPGTMVSCLTAMEGMFGTSRRITAAQYRRYWQIWPSSTSLGNAMQWAQIFNEPKVRFFHANYGPEYKLENVRAPVVLVSGSNDVLAAPEDIAEQRRRLRKAIRTYHNIPYYSHMDFIWDTGAVRTVYPIILEALADSFA